MPKLGGLTYRKLTLYKVNNLKEGQREYGSTKPKIYIKLDIYLARECTVRPFFRSPTNVMVSPLTVPISSRIVNISSNA